MVKICIVSYYILAETILLAYESLQKKGHSMYNFPLFKYMYDDNDKRNDYLEYMIDFVNGNKIDVLLWWFINIETAEFIHIKNKTNAKFILFNFDEPFMSAERDIKNKAPHFDCVFATCKETLTNYTLNGTKKAYYLLPAFDIKRCAIENLLSEDDFKKYSCDINFCCTNLYEDETVYPNQYINRKLIVDNIYNNQESGKYTFYIYGPDFLKNYYPKSYKGFIPYDEQYKLILHSKINLCTHVLSNMDGYINERAILVGGSLGLLFVDNVKGIDKIFDVNKELIIIDKYNYIDQIKNVLENYEMYIDMRKNLHNKCANNFTYDHWANYIHDHYLINL